MANALPSTKESEIGNHTDRWWGPYTLQSNFSSEIRDGLLKNAQVKILMHLIEGKDWRHSLGRSTWVSHSSIYPDPSKAFIYLITLKELT